MSAREPDADVLIVGAGAGGAAAAWALADAGVRVLVLEAGPRFDPLRDYRLDRPDWERTRFPRPPGAQGSYSYAPMQPLDAAFEGLRSWNHISGAMNRTGKRWGGGYAHVRGVGGSTLHFTGEAHRLHPEAFHLASRYGQGADWPIDYPQLEPYYVRAEQLVGVSGPEANPVRWRSAPFPLPAHAPGYTSRKLMQATESLGLAWEANALAVLSRPYDGRPGCNYCANCGRGCPRTDKGSADVTFMRKAEATGRCKTETGCTVLRLVPGRNDRIEGVEFRDRAGAVHRISPRVVVLACGAVETPRLLLLSANRNAQDGLANESGEVGRNFLETLFWTSAGLHDEPLGSHRGLPSDIICWDHNAPDGIDGVIGGCRFSIGTAEADLIGPIGYATRVVPGWGQVHKQAMREQFGRVLAVSGVGESLPHTGTFIDLDPDRTDASGLPLARIHSHLDASALRRMQFMADKCRQMLGACGIAKPFEEYGSSDFFLSTHVFGTCRMGSDPRTSVVNDTGRSHRWANLYISDASVFPSSGGGESPSLTIEALAIRTAEAIRNRLARREH